MQLIQVSGTRTQEEKTCGDSANIFFSPEVKNNAARDAVTAKADVWSIGAILYLLIIGEIENKKINNINNVSGGDDLLFNFDEPEWQECCQPV